MAVKKDKSRQRDVSQAKCETPGRIVLVGTYKGDQLTDWRGWYNYPISDSDFSRVEHVERVEGRARSPSAPQLPADYSCINELWLFKGTKDERRYKAEFVGVKTREELIRDYGYPAKGKAHGDRYLLFKTQFMYRHKADIPEDAERVIVRAADFAKRSPKVAKQLKAFLESPDRNDPDLAKQLPEIITKLRPDQLRVCEAAVQLDFLANLDLSQTRDIVGGTTRGNKYCHDDARLTCLDFFAGSGLVSAGLSSNFQTVWANDISPKKALVFNANNHAGVLQVCPIENISGKVLPTVDLSWGSFPCQDLSLAGDVKGHGITPSGCVQQNH